MSDDGRYTAKSLQRPPEQRRTEIVRRLLANESVEFAELAELNYEVHASWHLGVIATGTRPQDALRHAKADLGRGLLQASSGDRVVWAWFSLSRQLNVLDIERHLLADRTACEFLALGGRRWGLDGWRQTHREARGALLRALRRPERVVRYAESPLLAAALENETLATWLWEFLTPIRRRPDGVELLETLRAYIDTECNRSSAAPVVSVRRQTVGSACAWQRSCSAVRSALASLSSMSPFVSRTSVYMSRRLLGRDLLFLYKQL